MLNTTVEKNNFKKTPHLSAAGSSDLLCCTDLPRFFAEVSTAPTYSSSGKGQCATNFNKNIKESWCCMAFLNTFKGSHDCADFT